MITVTVRRPAPYSGDSGPVLVSDYAAKSLGLKQGDHVSWETFGAIASLQLQEVEAQIKAEKDEPS